MKTKYGCESGVVSFGIDMPNWVHESDDVVRCSIRIGIAGTTGSGEPWASWVVCLNFIAYRHGDSDRTRASFETDAMRKAKRGQNGWFEGWGRSAEAIVPYHSFYIDESLAAFTWFAPIWRKMQAFRSEYNIDYRWQYDEVACLVATMRKMGFQEWVKSNSLTGEWQPDTWQGAPCQGIR